MVLTVSLAIVSLTMEVNRHLSRGDHAVTPPYLRGAFGDPLAFMSPCGACGQTHPARDPDNANQRAGGVSIAPSGRPWWFVRERALRLQRSEDDRGHSRSEQRAQRDAGDHRANVEVAASPHHQPRTAVWVVATRVDRTGAAEAIAHWSRPRSSALFPRVPAWLRLGLALNDAPDWLRDGTHRTRRCLGRAFDCAAAGPACLPGYVARGLTALAS